jgi:hypothetical protein
MGKVLGRELVTATPQTGGVSAAGERTFTPTTPVVTFWASVQPTRQGEIELLEEGARRSAKWTLYPEGVPALDKDKAYRITCSKGTLIIVGYVDLAVHTTGLPHLAPVCTEVSADE